MRYFSTFTGAGGFEQAMPIGWKCVGMSEIDKYANMVLKYHYPDIKNYGDICAIEWDKIPDFDLLIGGSPCQDLSLAGKRKGLVGERSGLFFEYIQALKSKKPKYFIWENVKGALSSNEGWDFAEVQNQFSEVGYDIWWQVLNAKDFGVPQSRERIFVIGIRNGNLKQILFERESGGSNSKKRTSQIASTLRASDYKGGARRQHIIEVSPALQTDGILYQGSSWGTNNPQSSIAIRRFTPIECERLMGWQDNWTKYGIDKQGKQIEISDTQRRKLCGNGVVSNVVRELIKEMFEREE
jgi:DNA (cytosine-5)-methyltransferase 1